MHCAVAEVIEWDLLILAVENYLIHKIGRLANSWLSKIVMSWLHFRWYSFFDAWFLIYIKLIYRRGESCVMRSRFCFAESKSVKWRIIHEPFRRQRSNVAMTISKVWYQWRTKLTASSSVSWRPTAVCFFSECWLGIDQVTGETMAFPQWLLVWWWCVHLFWLNVHLSGEDNLGAVDVKRMSKIYREATESFMTERDSRVQACVIQDYITRLVYTVQCFLKLTRILGVIRNVPGVMGKAGIWPVAKPLTLYRYITSIDIRYWYWNIVYYVDVTVLMT